MLFCKGTYTFHMYTAPGWSPAPHDQVVGRPLHVPVARPGSGLSGARNDLEVTLLLEIHGGADGLHGEHSRMCWQPVWQSSTTYTHTRLPRAWVY